MKTMQMIVLLLVMLLPMLCYGKTGEEQELIKKEEDEIKTNEGTVKHVELKYEERFKKQI